MPALANDPAAAAAWLRTTHAVRERANLLYAAAQRGALECFGVDESRYSALADIVIGVIRARYPTLAIPFHSRWRHFDVGGIDRWARLRATLGDLSRGEEARLRIELAVMSVLLDAGAGPEWRYREPASGQVFSRSEGLAVASFDLFAARTDLATLTAEQLAAAFQVSDRNPLVGVEGRAALMRRLAATNIRGLYDALQPKARDGVLPANAIFAALIETLAPIWPTRYALGGIPLGDVWRHPAAQAGDATAGFVPLHKLTQWLTYSLIEPLEASGLTVSGLDDLTGLAEYRNGGLFVDGGLLVPTRDDVLTATHAVDSAAVVEWRALTVACLDRLAAVVRVKLERTAETMPLVRILEGGTWRAGRELAAERREGGAPPITVASDGTVF